MGISFGQDYEVHNFWRGRLAGGGKSWLGCEWLLTNCYFYPGSKWFIGREELKRLMGSSFISFQKVCNFHKIPKDDWRLDGKYNFIEFKNKSRIDLLDLAFQPRDPEFQRFGSLEYTGGWIEEAGEVKFEAFDVLKSRIGRHLNKDFDLLPPKMFLTCNPIKNWLYQLIYKPFRDGTLPEQYAFIQSLYGDNRWTADEYGEALSEIKDKATKQRLMYGNWEYDDDQNALMTYDAINDLFTNIIVSNEVKYLTADIARYGQDKTVVMLWKGFRVYYIEIWEKQGINVTSEKIRGLLKKYRIPYSQVIVDEGGVGGGVVDNLRGIKGFIANASPLENPRMSIFVNPAKLSTAQRNVENYRFLKDQCSYMLADKVNNHKIAIDCKDQKIRTMIIEELEQIKAKDMDKDSKLQVMPKEEVKEMIQRSPDFADCLVMRMYFELKGPFQQTGDPFKNKKSKFK